MGSISEVRRHISPVSDPSPPGPGSFERLIAKVISLPARRVLRSRRVSFLAGTDPETGRPRVLRGTDQSPILVQWQPAEKQERHIDVVVTQFS